MYVKLFSFFDNIFTFVQKMSKNQITFYLVCKYLLFLFIGNYLFKFYSYFLGIIITILL
jgi:hypothetical protein